MILKEDLKNAKKSIELNVGKKIKLKNRGSKSKIREGVIVKAYNSIFLVNIVVDEDVHTATTYTYKDLITESVIITLS